MADTRSPHAQGWIEGLKDCGVETLVFPTLAGHANAIGSSSRSTLSRIKARTPASIGNLALTGEALLKSQGRLRELDAAISAAKPDIIHGLRVPYEGLLAISAARRANIASTVSVWGVDFTYQAAVDPALRAWMRRLLPYVDGVHVDEPADIGRARKYGAATPVTLVAAGNFGLQLSIDAGQKEDLILAPRGFNERMDNELMIKGLSLFIHRKKFQGRVIFLNSGENSVISELSKAHPGVKIEARGWVPLATFRDLTSRARVVLSPAVVDGMPISVLEAIVRRAIPVTYDLPQFVRLAQSGAELVIVPVNSSADGYAQGLDQAWSRSFSNGRSVVLPEEYDRRVNGVRVKKFYNDALATRRARTA